MKFYRIYYIDEINGIEEYGSELYETTQDAMNSELYNYSNLICQIESVEICPDCGNVAECYIDALIFGRKKRACYCKCCEKYYDYEIIEGMEVLS